MPVDQSCIEAIFNYTTVIMNMIENREDMRSAVDVGEFTGSLISANVSSKLVDHWAKEVEVRCEVKMDDAIVGAIVDNEHAKVAPGLIRILRMIGKTEEEIRLEMAEIDKRASPEGYMYG